MTVKKGNVPILILVAVLILIAVLVLIKGTSSNTQYQDSRRVETVSKPVQRQSDETKAVPLTESQETKDPATEEVLSDISSLSSTDLNPGDLDAINNL